jgi:hypothetical protein
MKAEKLKPVRTVTSPVSGAIGTVPPAPPSLTDRQLGRITGLAAAGSTEGAIARSLGLSQGKWRQLKKADERVADALAEGLAMDLNACLNALRGAALDRRGAMRKRGGLVPLLAYLKLRHGLRDHGAAPSTEPTGVNVQIVLPGALTHEQFEAMRDITPALPQPAKEIGNGKV